MGRMTTRRRRTATADPGAGQGPRTTPVAFDAVGECLASGSDTVVACEVAGAGLARDGWSLAEVLDALAEVTRSRAGREPRHDESRAVAVAWSEATLAYLHGLSCEDPLTGLASPAHLRTMLAALYRAAGAEPSRVGSAHALVVVVAAPGADPDPDALTRAMLVAQHGATVRSVFSGTETIAPLAPGRLVVLAERDEHLARRVDLVLRMVGGSAWIEGLPETDEAAAALLDELARI